MNRSSFRHIVFNQAFGLEISFSIGKLFTGWSEARDRHSIDTQASRTADPVLALASLTRQGVGLRGARAQCEVPIPIIDEEKFARDMGVFVELSWSFRGNCHPRRAEKSSAVFFWPRNLRCKH